MSKSCRKGVDQNRTKLGTAQVPQCGATAIAVSTRNTGGAHDVEYCAFAGNQIAREPVRIWAAVGEI